MAISRLSMLKDPDELPDIYDALKDLFYRKTDGAPLAKIPPTKKDFKDLYGKADGAVKRARWEEIYPGLRESFSGLRIPFRLVRPGDGEGRFSEALSALR